MRDIPDDLKTKYFDIIYEFGLDTDIAASPSERLVIPVAVKDKDGNEFRGIFRGATVEEVCAQALVKLEEYGWKGHMQLQFEGLTGFCHAITNMICRGKAQVYFAP